MLATRNARCARKVLWHPSTPLRGLSTSSKKSRRIIGILRETKNKWERRAPLTPDQVSNLTQKGIQVLVQPSDRRVFTDKQYVDAGAIVSEDLSGVNTIFSVKEFPARKLIANKSYVLFSHTIKAQPVNMPFLDACLKKNIRLVDYEGIRDKTKRLVAFGRFAGLAGMVDTCSGLGERFLALGYSTPFLNVASSFTYPSVEAACDAVEKAGKQISVAGLPQSMCPVTFAFTGCAGKGTAPGNVARGALEVFKLLPHEMVSVSDLPEVVKAQKKGKNPMTDRVIGVELAATDLVVPMDDPEKAFDKSHYYQNPMEYRSVFHERIAPYTSVLVNGMYWDKRFPRLLTNEQIREMSSKMPNGMVMVSDLSIDIEGAIQFSSQATTIDSPFYVYDPATGLNSKDLDSDGILILGVDNLPAEFPRDASEHFANKLEPFVEALSVPQTDMKLDDLPDEIRKAVITDGGDLTKDYKYIEKLRETTERAAKTGSKETSDAPQHFKTVMMKGHLFDSQLINAALDTVEIAGLKFEVLEWRVGYTRDTPSLAIIRLGGQDSDALESVYEKLQNLFAVMPKSEAYIEELAYASATESVARGGPLAHLQAEQAPEHAAATTTSAPIPVTVLDPPEHRVLVLGSGMVAQPLVEYLSRTGKNVVTLVGVEKDQVNGMAQRLGRRNVEPVVMDASNPDTVGEAIKKHDVVISLLPQDAHPIAARHCIANKVPLVTASYVKPEMSQLSGAAEAAGIPIVMEMGLDPGLDHMSAISIIREIQEAGGEVITFESLCGGLPAPEAASNPLGYKFSWSPLGVLMATKNPAEFRRNGHTVSVPAEDLLTTAQPIHINTALNLEHLPNRNSLNYADVYGIQSAKTVYRGTLRYAGFSAIVDCMAQLGLLSDTEIRKVAKKNSDNWEGVLRALIASKMPTGSVDNSADLSDLIRARLEVLSAASPGRSSLSYANVNKAVEAIQWLGLDSKNEKIAPSKKGTVMQAMVDHLIRKLSYKPGERDMVLMHHMFGYRTAQGTMERRTSTLIAYGDNVSSAMAKTVGLPCAAGAQLILDGAVSSAGILLPTDASIYGPVLKKLESEGIVFDESVRQM